MDGRQIQCSDNIGVWLRITKKNTKVFYFKRNCKQTAVFAMTYSRGWITFAPLLIFTIRITWKPRQPACLVYLSLSRQWDPSVLYLHDFSLSISKQKNRVFFSRCKTFALSWSGRFSSSQIRWDRNGKTFVVSFFLSPVEEKRRKVVLTPFSVPTTEQNQLWISFSVRSIARLDFVVRLTSKQLQIGSKKEGKKWKLFTNFTRENRP